MIQSQLLELDGARLVEYVWLDPIGYEYVGNHNGAAKLVSTWCYVVFGSDLGNLYRGGELWGEGKILMIEFVKFFEGQPKIDVKYESVSVVSMVDYTRGTQPSRLGISHSRLMMQTEN